MATREEMVSAVEQALRRRFFGRVPKIERPDRANWGEVQHDTDRLSRCLAAYALVGACGIDDIMAVGAITDGSDDGGIDALYFDRANNRLVFVQSKYRTNGASPDQADALKTINGIAALRARQFDRFNEAIQRRLDDIEDALDTAGVRLQLLVVYLGAAFNAHAERDLNTFRDGINRFADVMEWRPIGLDAIYQWLIEEQTPTIVNEQIVLENWSGVVAPRRVFYGQLSAKALAELVIRHGTALFERNIRHYLGSVGVNTAIESTVRRRPGDFFYLNNGITAVADEIVQAPGNERQCAFGVRNLSIVNGAQTAGAIANAMLAGEIADEAKILITIIQIGDGADDIGRRITRARNHQNVVRGVDFAALDPIQEALRQELAAVRLIYYYRPSAEARVRSEDAFTLEEAALAIACLGFRVRTAMELERQPRIANAVDFVVAAKKEIGRLWEQEGTLYGQLFPAGISGVRVCRLVRIFRFIDQILTATERAEHDYHRRTFFRHGRYFIMAFVAQRCPDVIGRGQFDLAPEDKTTLSQQTNELSELIYAASEPLQAFKGYLAIFRNLTDAQPLANSVLQRLVERDIQQQPVPPAQIQP